MQQGREASERRRKGLAEAREAAGVKSPRRAMESTTVMDAFKAANSGKVPVIGRNPNIAARAARFKKTNE